MNNIIIIDHMSNNSKLTHKINVNVTLNNSNILLHIENSFSFYDQFYKYYKCLGKTRKTDRKVNNKSNISIKQRHPFIIINKIQLCLINISEHWRTLQKWIPQAIKYIIPKNKTIKFALPTFSENLPKYNALTN